MTTAASGKSDSWNPRYSAYAKAHNRSKDDQLEHDREAFPGGHMAGFMLWIGERWRVWDELDRFGQKADRWGSWDHVRSDEEHAAFTQWLQQETSR